MVDSMGRINRWRVEWRVKKTAIPEKKVAFEKDLCQEAAIPETKITFQKDLCTI